jgi:predicted nucleotidyltransferase component of viral defense system
MIPRDFITEWRSEAPWRQDAQVEQDLVISRAIVEIFRTPGIANRLAFRGGTALNKLYLSPAARYSEDIDLVQIEAEPIGDTIDLLRSALDPWLGKPHRKLKEGRANLVYRFQSEDNPPLKMRLKIETNSREHFTELGLIQVTSRVTNRWFTGEAEVTTYELNELLATKLRALYQRKKGRDLFDLWFAFEQGNVDEVILLRCFERYMAEGGHRVTRAQFEANLHKKATDTEFREDILPLLRPNITWDFPVALEVVKQRLISRLPSNPWQNSKE